MPCYSPGCAVRRARSKQEVAALSRALTPAKQRQGREGGRPPRATPVVLLKVPSQPSPDRACLVVVRCPHATPTRDSNQTDHSTVPRTRYTDVTNLTMNGVRVGDDRGTSFRRDIAHGR